LEESSLAVRAIYAAESETPNPNPTGNPYIVSNQPVCPLHRRNIARKLKFEKAIDTQIMSRYFLLLY
jgi:hypothetical protein